MSEKNQETISHGKERPQEGTREATPHFNTNHSCKITVIFKFYSVRIHPVNRAVF